MFNQGYPPSTGNYPSQGYSSAGTNPPPPQGAYPPPQGTYPPSQGAYPPSQGTYPPTLGTYPPSQGAYPPAQGAYPPSQGTYPPPQGTYPPSQGAYPPSQGAYPPPQGAYPPSQGAYSPSQGAYPPQQGAYPPTQPGVYPPPGGMPPMGREPIYKQLTVGRGIDMNEYNNIVGVIKQIYMAGTQPMGTACVEGIRRAIGGDWFIFISDVGIEDYDFSLTRVKGGDFISFSLDNKKFQVCRIR